MYKLLETFLPETMEKEDIEPKSILGKDWSQLVEQAGGVRNELQTQQAEFKKTLVVGVDALVTDVHSFRDKFEKEGPMVPGIEPREALNRLRMFQEEYSIRQRKYQSYYSGETLFGLPHTQYPKLEKTQKEIELLDKLYNLYSKVKDTISKWKEISWLEITKEISSMTETIEIFQRDCAKLPGVLKGWDAYKELKTEVDDMSEIIPLVEALAKPSIKPRHWDEVISLTKKQIPYQADNFNL
jgi:dynein heavy chain, axonemal